MTGVQTCALPISRTEGGSATTEIYTTTDTLSLHDALPIADHLARSRTAFDLVLSSTALRTQETAQPIIERLKPRRVLFDRDLYLAPGTALLDRLRRIEESVESVLLVGHNPGMHGLALSLAAPGSPARLPPLSGKFPTGALACYRFKAPWRRLARVS